MDRKLAREAHLDELPLRARRGRAGCANTYATSVYDEGTKDLLAALQSSGFDMTHLHNHEAVESFPFEASALTSLS
jgi:uncharacterized membrane protein